MPVRSVVKSSGNASNICFTLATASSDCSWQTPLAPIFCGLNIFLSHDTFHPYWMLKSHHILTKMNWPFSSHNSRRSCTIDHCMYLHLDELRNCLYSRMGKLDCQNGRLHQKVRCLWKQFRTWVQSSWPGLVTHTLSYWCWNSIDETLAYSKVVDFVAHGTFVVGKSVGYSSGTADSLARTWQHHFHNLVKDWNCLVTPWGKLVFSLLFL